MTLDELAAALAAWRARSPAEQQAYFDSRYSSGDPVDPAGRIRVGFLGPVLNQGGAEAWQVLLARSLDPARFAAMGAVATHGAGSIHPAMAEAYRGICPVGAGRAAARELAGRVDVLVTWAIDRLPELVEGLAARPRVLGVVHAPKESLWGQSVYARPESIDRWVAVSELAAEAIPPASAAAAPVSTIWNAVDAGRLEVRRDRAAMRSTWGIPADVPVAGFLQRLTSEKDPLAAARLAAELPEPWRVVVVGAGNYAPQLEAMKAEGRLDRLHLVGPDNAAGDCLNAFDCLVVASEYESFGLTLGEGLWMGCPVVSTDVGIARLRPGLTYPIGRNAAGPELARAVAEAHRAGPRPGSREWARERLAPDRFAREWGELLAGVAPRRRRKPDEDLRLAMAADTCPSGSGPCGCGSGPPRLCSRPGRPAEVRRADCLACASAEWWGAGVDPAW